MEYNVIISHDSLQDLIDLVNKAIAEGWYPFGSVSVSQAYDPDPYDSCSAHSVIWAQTMAKGVEYAIQSRKAIGNETLEDNQQGNWKGGWIKP